MHTAPIFKNGERQVVYLPTDMAYEVVRELEITPDKDLVILHPVRHPGYPILSCLALMPISFISVPCSWMLKSGANSTQQLVKVR